MRDVVDRSRLFAMVPYDIIKEIENGNAIALYAVLKMYAGSNQNAFPSRSRLAKHLGYKSPRMVDLALDRLTELGLVKIVPRFKDEAGNIAYERSDVFREQTSNGYVVYDQIVRQDQLQFDTPLDTGVHTPTHPCAHPLDTGVHTPYTPVSHEGYSLEGDSSEGDKDLVHPRANARRGNRFDEFWDRVPKGRKSGKDDARKAYAAAVKRVGDEQVLIDGMERYANDPNLPAEKQFIKLPATWLRKGCWNDDPLPQRLSTVDSRERKSSSDVMAWFTPAGGAPTGPSSTVVDAEVLDQRELGA